MLNWKGTHWSVRLLAAFLAFVMLLGSAPASVFATEIAGEESGENPWEGRSAVFVGDSITAGSGTTKIYYQYLEETLGFGSVTAMGVTGSCISAASDYGQKNQPLINRYQNIPSADLIVIFMGTNDYGHETPLGSESDTQDGTFYGALNVIIPALVAKHTSSKIVFVTPLHRYGFGTSKILGTQFTYDNIPNGVGATLGDYVEALKTVCANHGVSVIDLHTECTLDPTDSSVREQYMPDGLHPNAAGHELIAGIMESHIRSLEPAEKAPETETEPEEETELVYGNKFASGFTQQNRASSRINQYLRAGTVITLKDPAVFQWACAKTNGEFSNINLGYFPDNAWSDKETAVVETDGWVGFTFKYRDETKVFDLTKPLSDYITIEVPHTHNYENGICTDCGETEPFEATSDIDIFVFAGQSNMMGAAVLEPEVGTFTEKALEYKYMPKLRGAETGSFVAAQNPAGEFHYKNLAVAYGDKLSDLSYQSSLSNYSANTYFCPAMRDGVKGFSAQSEADTYPSASLAPYFVTEYADYGHSSVYAHMAKGAVKIDHYFTEEMVTRYNALISEYNTQNNKSYSALTSSGLSGAGDAFDDKYNAMLEDYAAFAPDNTVKNKCFVWLQGEGDAGRSYIEYKLKLQVLWEHLQELGFTHFFVLRVGYWGSTGILNVIKAQEDFCAENDNCYIVTRAPSLIPHPSATTDNWWISEPSAEYDDCRDSYLVDSGNNHFNEKAMQIFAERSAENVHRILHLGLEPVLEEENIQGMQDEEKPDEDLPEDTTPYTSYLGTEVFHNGLSVSKKSDNTWEERSSSSAASTDLIPVKSNDSVWLQYVFFKSEAHAVGGFYDVTGNLVAPLYFKDFGFSADGSTGGVTAFRTPEKTNRVSVAAVESATGKEIAFVRFTAWQASAGGHANTEARIYHDYSTVVTAPTCTEQGYTTHTCACGDKYVDSYVDAAGHDYECQVTLPVGTVKGHTEYACSICGDAYQTAWLDPAAYEGMTLACVGDSITAAIGVTKDETDYVKLLAQQLGMDYIRVGASGTTLCTDGHRTCNISRLTESYLKGADVVTILMGINDFDQAKLGYYELGDINSTDSSTIYGAVRMWCERIVELRKTDSLSHTQFYFATPVICSWNDSVTSKRNWDQSKTNIHGYTLRDLCNAIVEVAALYDVAVIDLNLLSGMYYVDETDNNTAVFGGDGVHPGEKGHEMMANALAKALLQNNLRNDHEHAYGSWITTAYPSCQTGKASRVCSICSAVQVKELEPNGEHKYVTATMEPTCTEKGYTTYTCSKCDDSYVDSYVDATGHSYENGVCTDCGVSILGSDWLKSDFAQGDYTMVVLPDTQILVQYWPEIYRNQMQWIADNRDTLNIQAVLHMGDMVNNNDAEWTVCESGTDILENAGIPWMPMRGNHDDSTWFNKYYDYATYGTNQSWFGGSYHEDKLDHTYWFVTVGEREYMILSLGWAPSWDVLKWAQGVVEEHSDKSVILACHAYMNKDGSLLTSSPVSGYPSGKDVWNAFKGYGNVALAMGGHVHSADLVTWVGQNGAGRDVTSLLVDRQNDDISNGYAMIALLTFHADSETVDINWYSTRYDALYREKNQFSISVPHVCVHSYISATTEPTCTEGGGTRYTCTICGSSYVEETSEPLGHDYETVVTPPTCTDAGYTTHTCSRCKKIEYGNATDLTEQLIWVDSYRVDCTTGQCIVDANWVHSKYYDISGYSALAITMPVTTGASTTTGLAFYDTSKNYISGVSITSGAAAMGYETRYISVPECAMYIRSTWYSGSNSDYESAWGKAICFAFAEESLLPLGHDYEAVITDPTCTEKGYTTHICSVCGDSYVDCYVDVAGHKFGDWIVTTGPSCTEKGAEQRDCEYCDHSETREVEATGHSYEAVVTAPTCTEQGYTTHTCACGDSYVDSYVDATGHKFGDWVITTKPTCTEKGAERRDCDNCDHFETREVEATGHSYEAVVTAPTCDEKGFTTHTCSKCGDSYVDSYVDAAGHKFGDWTEIKAPTCTQKGAEQRDCENCDHFETREVEATGHSYEAVVTDPTCTEKGYTTYTCTCGDSYVDSYVDAAGHKFGDWTVTAEPNCTEKGAEQRDCDNCEHFETRKVEATGHSYEAVVTEPTCTEQGYTTHTCACGDSYVDGFVDATGHKFGDWTETRAPTCTAKGEEQRDCGNCDHFETRAVDATGHDYDAVVTAPTCTEQGYTTHTCACGDSYVDGYVDPTGHEFGEWTAITESTCTEKGTEQRDCENCDYFETREVEALGHDYEAVVTKPTCTEQGYTTHTCACGDSYVDSHVDATGHKFGDWTETRAPTCTEKGSEQRDCANCNHFETREVEATGHDYETVITKPTCTEQGYTTHTCAKCGDSYVDSYVNALGHEYGGWYVTKEATLESEGEERRDCGHCDDFQTRKIPKLVHNYTSVVTEPTCTEQGYTTHTCQNCGDEYMDTYVNALGHSFKDYVTNNDATCTADGTKTAKCERCEEMDTIRDAGTAKGHKFGKWTVTDEPTCTEKGEERRDCANCDHFETREVEANGHDYEAVVTKPTCTEQGYTTHTCACGDSYVDSYVDPTGHEFGEWTVTTEPTCTEKGAERRDCANCDHFETREIATTGHDYEAVVTKPTCVDKGFTTHTCSKCEDSYIDSYVNATGHKFGDWTVTAEPTCTEKGAEQRGCDNCEHFETREVDALGHSYEEVVIKPTCEDKGYTTHTCSKCGDSYVDNYVDATGHKYENGTCTECGEPEVKYLRGDVDLDGDVDVDDVLALLWYVLFPEDYPISVDADFDRNGNVDVDDVLALLWYVLFPDDYPLN